MIVTKPMPFKEAQQADAVRTLLPTAGASADIAMLEPAIKRRAMVSATVDTVNTLQDFAEGVDDLLAGNLDQATVRSRLKDLLEASGYRPEPELAGGLQDLSSDRRLNLVLETNVQTAQGYGRQVQGMQPEVLDQFPAQQLFDTKPGGTNRRDWAARWQQVGGQFYGNEMIALKTDPIWERLGTAFPDSLGNPFPPFAFGSWWDVRDVDHDKAVAIGLIDEDEVLTPAPADDFSAEADVSPEVRESWLQDAITQSGVGSIQNGKLIFDGGGL